MSGNGTYSDFAMVPMNGGTAVFGINAAQDLKGWYGIVSHGGVDVWVDPRRFKSQTKALNKAKDHVTKAFVWLFGAGYEVDK